MDTSREISIDAGMLDDARPASELTLVEIAGRLEKITSAIEGERARERVARKAYKVVADEVEAEIERIRGYARTLVTEQRRRIDSFNGMLGKASPPPLSQSGSSGEMREIKFADHLGELGFENGSAGRDVYPGARLSITEAILKVWALERNSRPLTTEEIARALPEVGYTTKAAPRSVKSTLNQALAKLCRDRKIRRFRTDGEEIDASDTHSRARKYMAV